MRVLRKTLDGIYYISGIIASLFLIAILLIIVAQMVARWTGNVFPGATAYAGYCMAAASFFALANAFNYGSHIRVSLMLNAMGRYRRIGEIWGYGVGAVTATLFARYAVKTNFLTEKLNDISQGQDATPIWIPQLAMSFGSILLAVALWDHLLRIIFTKHMGVVPQDFTEARD